MILIEWKSANMTVFQDFVLFINTLLDPKSLSPRKRAIITPKIAPIPFAKKSAHEACRPNEFWPNSINPPKIITPNKTQIINLGFIKVIGNTRQKNDTK